MNPILGWALAALLAVASFWSYGWPGLAMAASAVVFWLLLQFNRAVRVMKNAADRPLAHVPNAVMFHAGLRRGATLVHIVAKTRSLGRRLPDGPDSWAWSDDAGDTVALHFENGRLERWSLTRADLQA